MGPYRVDRCAPLASAALRHSRLRHKGKLNRIGELSGHSFCVGAAVGLLYRGVPLERIMLRGGWQTDSTAMKYLRNWVYQLIYIILIYQ